MFTHYLLSNLPSDTILILKEIPGVPVYNSKRLYPDLIGSKFRISCFDIKATNEYFSLLPTGLRVTFHSFKFPLNTKELIESLINTYFKTCDFYAYVTTNHKISLLEYY